MTISKNDLISIVKSIMDVAGNKGNLIFHNGKISSVGEFATVQVNLEGAGFDELEGSVSADTFFKAVSKLTKDEVTLSMMADKKSISIKAGRCNQKVVCNQISGNKVLEDISEVNNWVDIPLSFGKGLELCYIDKNKSNLLDCICVYGKRMFSTDKSQIINYNMSEDVEFPNFILPSNCVHILLKSIKKLNKVAVTENYICFKNENMTICFRPFYMENGYIPEASLDKILNVENNVCLEGKLPAKLIEVVERASLFGLKDGYNKTIVNVTFEEHNIHVTACSDLGEFSEDVESDLCPDTPIVTHMSYEIVSFLNKRDSDFKITFNEGLNIGDKIVFTSDNCKYVSMLFTSEGK